MSYNPLNNPIVNTISQRVYNAAKDILGDKLDRVYLFGSYARGDYDHESDIDYMIIANLPQEEACAQRLRISKRLSGLDLEFDTLIACCITGSEVFNRFAKASSFYQNILTEGVELNEYAG